MGAQDMEALLPLEEHAHSADGRDAKAARGMFSQAIDFHSTWWRRLILVCLMLEAVIGVFFLARAGVHMCSRHMRLFPMMGGKAIMTGPESEFPVRFLNLGDWGRDGKYNQSLIAEQMGRVGERINSQFVISNGDNFYDEGLKNTFDEQFSTSFSDIYTAPSLQTPWYAVLGNHDYYGNVLAQLDARLRERDPRWHCMRSGRMLATLCSPMEVDCSDYVEFFFFDSTPFVVSYRNKSTRVVDWHQIDTDNWDAYNKQQVIELRTNLASSSARWKIVISHHPVYSYGDHGTQAELLNEIKPVLESEGVDVFIHGHDHCIQHIKHDDSPVHFFDSGGGSKAFKIPPPENPGSDLKYYWEGQAFGAVLIDKSTFLIEFYGVAGDMIYSYTLKK
eukprot:TRINITY_DN21615_c0_g1_i1.p1 TRINITY_DN21615_c0_g1~~TRINITY_DN21615_c0_g1_i1.p1  ORF type:complete len:390 (+),score=71.77 TRINITY_DN21615_c0_g1_i1:117-1286(+)